jgi:uncharacterized protein YndB with AHSA1/START domain
VEVPTGESYFRRGMVGVMLGRVKVAVEVRSDRTFEFPVGPADLWSALTAVDRYRRWWPWLRRFDGRSFSEGAHWRCEVRSPLLYRVRFEVVLDEVVGGRSASVTVVGDIAGHARLDVTPREDGSRLRLVSVLAPHSRLLQTIGRLVPPVARLGHDRLLDTGVRQFRARALGPGR